jgi:glycosyltransferase involved in cell wall biosynthesis
VKQEARKKRIAIVSNTTWNIYNFRLNVLQKFIDEGYELFVIAPVDKFIKYLDDFPEVTHMDLHQLDRKGTNPLQELRLTWELRRIYKKIQPDLIIHYTVKPNIYGGMAAGSLGIPSIAVVTGLGYAFIHGGWVKTFTKYLYRISSRFHSKVIFENKDDLQLFEDMKMIQKRQGISIKGCGVSAEHFHPSDTQKKTKELVFTFVGRLLYDKGLKEFVEAANILLKEKDQIKFWIIGDFDKDNPASVPEPIFFGWLIPGKIEYLGFREDIRPYIAQSDCIVLPSYREAIARALTEAMAMEKPVIATKTAGCIEAVDEGVNGFLVPVKDGQALAQSFHEFLSLSEEKRLAIGKNGRIKVLREFDDRLIADQLFEIIQDLIA